MADERPVMIDIKNVKKKYIIRFKLLELFG